MEATRANPRSDLRIDTYEIKLAVRSMCIACTENIPPIALVGHRTCKTISAGWPPYAVGFSCRDGFSFDKASCPRSLRTLKTSILLTLVASVGMHMQAIRMPQLRCGSRTGGWRRSGSRRRTRTSDLQTASSSAASSSLWSALQPQP